MDFWSGFTKQAEETSKKKRSLVHPFYATVGAFGGAAYGWHHGLPITTAPKDVKGAIEMLLEQSKGRFYPGTKSEIKNQIKGLKAAKIGGILLPALAGAIALHGIRNMEDLGNKIKGN